MQRYVPPSLPPLRQIVKTAVLFVTNSTGKGSPITCHADNRGGSINTPLPVLTLGAR